MTHPDTIATTLDSLPTSDDGATLTPLSPRGERLGVRTTRDSGIPWLGAIPAHWQVAPLKRVTTYVNRGDSPDYVDESSIQVINQACIQWDGLHLENVKFQREVDLSAYDCRLRCGDVLINSTGTGTLGRTIVFEESGGYMADGHVTIIRCQHDLTYPNYVSYLLRTNLYQGYIYSALVAGSTNQIELSREGLRAMAVILPPLAEQRAIAAYLDRETARLDALVAAKERLIALLRERRAALISRAVTRGLDAAAPLRDSGVPWLGEIPAHWQVKRLKTICCQGLVNGLFKTKDRYGSGAKLVNVVNLYRDNFQIDMRSLERVQADAQEQRNYAVLPGNIFFVRSSLKMEGVAAAALAGEIDEPTVFECHLVRARLRECTALPSFVVNYLNSSTTRQHLVSLAETTTMTTIGQSELAGLEMFVPPMPEQRVIADYLDRETAKLDALVAAIRRHIEKVREYRAALIAAAVTGKIDVREWEADDE